MNKLSRVLIVLFAAYSTISITAQTEEKILDKSNMRDGESVEYCFQHKKMMELLKDPAQLKIWQASQQQLKEAEDLYYANRSAQRGVVYKIPIVFHVLHNGGAENISDAQVMDAFEILNRDFRKLNADTATVASQFQGLPADAEIEFVLATKDPAGNCFSGITRTNDPITSDGSSGNAQVNAIVSGNDVYNGTWPEREYLNIFIVQDCGGAAGYTYNPFWNGTSTSGIWILHNYVGSIETGSVGRSRALTHEVGHWLNLSHTWGPNNNPGNASSCNDDDGVTDTPNTIGVTSCALSENTCGPLANVENYMDYSYCSKMFTPGQVARMRSALNSSAGGRNNLWSTSNLNATGTNGNAPLCAAEFSSDNVIACAGNTITFSDDSYHDVTSRTWTFAGGTPSTSTSANPTVTYNTPGTYTVTLTVSNGGSTLTETKTDYVTVLASPGRPMNVVEGFESLTLPDANWVVDNPGGNTWEITSNVAATGSKCLMIDNYNNTGGVTYEFLSSTIDMSNMTDVELTFKYAFAKKNSSNSDQLQVKASKNCGVSWNTVKSYSTSIVGTTSTTTSPFTPQAGDWRDVTVTTLNSGYWLEDFMFKISFQAGGGNNIYLDDINLFDPNTLSVQDNDNLTFFSVYPNPSNGNNVNINISLENASDIDMTIVDMLGKTVSQVSQNRFTSGNHSIPVDISHLSQGVYIINLVLDGELLTKKLIVE